MAETIYFYNTLSKKKEEFIPIDAPNVSLYVCGVTVYDYCHIGHARTYVVFDTLVRLLRDLEYQVKYVRNITDVDDKIIAKAKENQEDYQALVQRNVNFMYEDFDRLNLLRPDIEPTVSGNMPEIIQMIEMLVDKGYAYQTKQGDVLFSVDKYVNYGQLSKQDLSQLKAGIRIDVDPDKNNPIDFVLWKHAKKGEPAWASSFGEGRPGWHIECSAMNYKYLGRCFDIHGGGSDLIFPHHENEIAQSCCALDSNYVNYWIHSGMVQVNQEKMSKSLNNFFTIREVFELYQPETVRYFLLSSHYRSELNYSVENLNQAHAALKRLYTALRGVQNNDMLLCDSSHPYYCAFMQAMRDDLNTPIAISVLFEIAKELNIAKEKKDMVLSETLSTLLIKLGSVLGILQLNADDFLRTEMTQSEIEEIEALIVTRNNARKNKDWQKADEVRDTLTAMGVTLEDFAQGTTWSKSSFFDYE